MGPDEPTRVEANFISNLISWAPAAAEARLWLCLLSGKTSMLDGNTTTTGSTSRLICCCINVEGKWTWSHIVVVVALKGGGGGGGLARLYRVKDKCGKSLTFQKAATFSEKIVWTVKIYKTALIQGLLNRWNEGLGCSWSLSEANCCLTTEKCVQ